MSRDTKHQESLRNIPFFHEHTGIQPITKGYSSDNKYIVTKASGKFLVRTFAISELDRKREEFHALFMMEESNVNCSRPVELGELKDQGLGYMILTYIEGNDAIVDLPKYSTEDQYNIGFEAGIELAKIHRHLAPDTITAWHERKIDKHKKYIEDYNQLGIRIHDDSKIMTFIDDNIHLMINRPNRFQHDDYHVGNLIVKDNKFAGIIDFNRFDWGDPIHDFLKVGMFSSEVSVPFSVGQIRGYHHNQEPTELFWKLNALYLAMCLISSVVWIVRVKPEETDVMLRIINRVIEDHHGFESIKPRWYNI